MSGRKMIVLLLTMAMMMSAAAFAYADEEIPEGQDQSQQEQQLDPEAKADQVIVVKEELRLVKGKSDKLDAKLEAGDGALTYETSDKNVVTVDKDGKLKAKAIGFAVITVTAAETEKYGQAVKEVKVTVAPKAISITSLTCKKKGELTVKWKKLKDCDGYEIEYCQSKKDKKDKKDKDDKKVKKVKKVKDKKAESKKINNLKKKTKYYVRIRVYKTVGDEKIYSEWSKEKMIKTK